MVKDPAVAQQACNNYLRQEESKFALSYCEVHITNGVGYQVDGISRTFNYKTYREYL